MTEPYKMGDYERIVQRHIMPLWIKDKDGGYDFSSTSTFIKYYDKPYCIFTEHCLKGGIIAFEEIGTFGDKGAFISISDISSQHYVFEESDIVVCSMIGFAPRKRHFDLNKKYDGHEFNKKILNWLGFPAKKSKKHYHHTRVKAGRVADDLRPADDGQLIWRNADFLWPEAEFMQESGDFLEAYHSQKNTTYQIEGTKSQGYSLAGMSGGALFYVPKPSGDQETVDGEIIIEFAGMGTDYNHNVIKGVSINKIMNLIDSF